MLSTAQITWLQASVFTAIANVNTPLTAPSCSCCVFEQEVSLYVLIKAFIVRDTHFFHID